MRSFVDWNRPGRPCTTSLDSTVWQSIAYALGPEAVRAEVETHKRWDRGEFANYLDWMKTTIKIHKSFGLTQQLFSDVISSTEYNPGVEETLLSLDRASYEPVLVSGGFRELALRAQTDLGIDHAFCAWEYFFDQEGAPISFPVTLRARSTSSR